MRNLLALLGAATVTFVGLGWYLDWYRVERQPAPTGYQRLQLDINPSKIGADVQSGIERGAELLTSLRDKPHPPGATPPAAILQGGLTTPLLPDVRPAPAPNRGPLPAPPGQGWRPIGSTSSSRSADDEALRRFNVRPLPSPR